jgi:hypothetical protein
MFVPQRLTCLATQCWKMLGQHFCVVNFLVDPFYNEASVPSKHCNILVQQCWAILYKNPWHIEPGKA